jgi:hypothetical protein
MPNFAGKFAAAVDYAADLSVAGEQARVLLSTRKLSVQPLTINKLEMLYEMAFLRMFTQWETFLEQTFIRYICGYTCTLGPVTMITGSYFPTLAAAQYALLGKNTYLLWHSPSRVIDRVKRYITNGLHEQVISSSQFRLELFAAIRHRIAHDQEHTRIQFDRATMHLHARRYPGSRPGKFLRDWAPQVPPQRWLNLIASEFKRLSVQITP